MKKQLVILSLAAMPLLAQAQISSESTTSKPHYHEASAPTLLFKVGPGFSQVTTPHPYGGQFRENRTAFFTGILKPIYLCLGDRSIDGSRLYSEGNEGFFWIRHQRIAVELT